MPNIANLILGSPFIKLAIKILQDSLEGFRIFKLLFISFGIILNLRYKNRKDRETCDRY